MSRPMLLGVKLRDSRQGEGWLFGVTPFGELFVHATADGAWLVSWGVAETHGHVVVVTAGHANRDDAVDAAEKRFGEMRAAFRRMEGP